MIDKERLCRIEDIVDKSGVAKRIEALLPIGCRPRQLSVRTFLVGTMASLAGGRPGHLICVHRVLLSLSEADQLRLGILVDWGGRNHLLTYRQVEYTFSRIVKTLSKEAPSGEPSNTLSGIVDSLVEASVPERHKATSRSLAVDWTDIESFAKPVSAKELERGTKLSADPCASWGHRRGDSPGQKDEMFFGYYLSLATMVKDEQGQEVPELVRRMNLTSCHVDPVPAFVPVLKRLSDLGVAIGDILADSGYAHRTPEHWALPLRMLGAKIITDLHPNDRGCQGTYVGTILFNGNLYCPATPVGLFDIAPLSRHPNAEEIKEHDGRSAELSRYKFSAISSDDADGYHRVICPAKAGRVRCRLKQDSMALGYNRPEVLDPPGYPPTCCDQATITVPPIVNAKTRQKHDYPSKSHRESYARRTAVERSNSRIKDPATTDVSKGWCRLMGLTPLVVFLACALVTRNMAVTDAFDKRQTENAKRLEEGKPLLTRKRRRRSINDLLTQTTPAA